MIITAEALDAAQDLGIGHTRAHDSHGESPIVSSDVAVGAVDVRAQGSAAAMNTSRNDSRLFTNPACMAGVLVCRP